MKNSTLSIVVVAIMAAVVLATVCFAFGSNNEKTVTFDQNYQDSSDIVVKVTNGDEVSSPYAVRAGYTLVGWYKDKECTDIASFPCKITGDTRFYARWSDKMISTIFNEDYLTGTESGKALCNKSQITAGAAIVKIDGKLYNTNVVSSGQSYIILDLNTGDDKYSVVSFKDFSVMFTIPSKDLVLIKNIGTDVFSNEFFIVQYTGGYYIYDLKGNSVGPALSEPTLCLSDSVLFNGTFYRFKDDGRIYAAFDLTKDTHIPEGGNGTTFYECASMDINKTTYYYGVNILNDKYQVIKEVKFTEKADICSCVTLANGGYLIQNAVKGSSSAEYTTVIDGVSYILRSVLVDKDLNESTVHFNRYIEKSMDRVNSPGIEWDMYAHDTVSIVSVQVPGSGELTQMVTISSNGKHVTCVDMINDVTWSSVQPMSVAYHYIITVPETTVLPTVKTNILDGSGHLSKIAVADIVNANGVRYFIKNDDSTYGIYDVNGTVVGNYSGYTYKASSHNDLFFEKDGNTYVFRDAAMTKLCDGSDVQVYDWGYSIGTTNIISGTPKTTYTYYTENGSIIASSAGKDVTAFITDSGEYVLNIKIASGEYRLFELTA